MSKLSIITTITLALIFGTQANSAQQKPYFSKGADIGWVSEMEQQGHKFYNRDGVETDCFVLMKQLGMDAIRLRVWVNPDKRFNATPDVVGKAVRAKRAGMDVMLDFHYSDNWADPGQQRKPRAWRTYSAQQIERAVYHHTTQVLEAVKLAGVGEGLEDLRPFDARSYVEAII